MPEKSVLLLRNSAMVPLFYGEFITQNFGKRSGSTVALDGENKPLKKDFILVKCNKIIPRNNKQLEGMLTPSKMPVKEALGEVVDWPCSCVSYAAPK